MAVETKTLSCDSSTHDKCLKDDLKLFRPDFRFEYRLHHEDTVIRSSDGVRVGSRQCYVEATCSSFALANAWTQVLLRRLARCAEKHRMRPKRHEHGLGKARSAKIGSNELRKRRGRACRSQFAAAAAATNGLQRVVPDVCGRGNTQRAWGARASDDRRRRRARDLDDECARRHANECMLANTLGTRVSRIKAHPIGQYIGNPDQGVWLSRRCQKMVGGAPLLSMPKLSQCWMRVHLIECGQ